MAPYPLHASTATMLTDFLRCGGASASQALGPGDERGEEMGLPEGQGPTHELDPALPDPTTALHPVPS